VGVVARELGGVCSELFVVAAVVEEVELDADESRGGSMRSSLPEVIRAVSNEEEFARRA